MADQLPDRQQPKRPRGRPPVAPGEARTERMELRLTRAQREKVDALGGVEWVRRQIDAAPEPGA